MISAPEQATATQTKVDTTAHLIVFNDNEIYFQYAVECLMNVLGIGADQAEQLAWIIDRKGRASVKEGSYQSLRMFKDALIEKGLTAEIEKV